MLLAEALIRRKELKTRTEDLKNRLEGVALISEGDEPLEDPLELLDLLESTLDEHRRLVTAIHLTNLAAKLGDGRSLTEAIVERDTLDERMAIFRALAQRATPRQDRYSRSELRLIATLNVAELRQQVDRWAKRRREVDTAIQRANWHHEVLGG